MTWGEVAGIITAFVAILTLMTMLVRHWMSQERERTEAVDNAQQKQIDELFRKNEMLRKDIHNDIAALSKKIDSMAKDLNRLIGRLDGSNYGG